MAKKSKAQLQPALVLPTQMSMEVKRAFGMDVMHLPVLFKRDEGKDYEITSVGLAAYALREMVRKSG